MAEWAPAVPVYVVVYPAGVLGPFNRDVNVKSPPRLSPLWPARIRERYDRFYIQASTPRPAGFRGWETMHDAPSRRIVEKRRRAEITAKKWLTIVSRVSLPLTHA